MGTYTFGENNLMEKYQDYIIRDGVFIGKFEEMYQKFSDPWHQLKEVDNSYSRLDTVLSLRKLKVEAVLEVGCGLGVFTSYLSQALPNIKIVGMDISKTAVSRASERYPKLKFIACSLNDIDKVICDERYNFDIIILSEVMWYILKDLDMIIEKLRRYFAGKYVIINQTFYKGKQQYGKEYFTNMDEMTQYLQMHPVTYTMAFSDENEISYETHSVFKI